MDNNTLAWCGSADALLRQALFADDARPQDDYVKLAEAFGAKGYVLAGEADIEPVLKKAFAEKGPVLVDCKIGIDDKVLPMIPPGKTFDDIITKL